MKQIFIGSVILLLFASCAKNKKSEKPASVIAAENRIKLTAEQIKNAGISYTQLQQNEIASVLKVNGKIDVPPQNMVSISVPLGGYLKSTKLLPGQHVYKGEVIALMEGEQYIQLQQDYLMVKEKVHFLETEYARQKELNKHLASSDKIFQQAETDLKSQYILLAALNSKLELVGINTSKLTVNNISKTINIYSPINGYVSVVNVNIGKYVSPTEVLFELINPSDIHLALKIFEKDIPQLRVGQKLVAYTNNLPGNKHPCEILLIGKDISAERSIDVHCHFEDYDPSLIPGTYMNAEIKVTTNKAYVLPETAVVRFENRQYAFVRESTDLFSMIEVQTGTIENGYVEILNNEKLRKLSFINSGSYSLLMSLKNRNTE